MVKLLPITCKIDLAAAAAQERAFVFLWVNWAVHAHESQRVVEAVVDLWHSEHTDTPSPCYIADVSDQCGELWDALVEWLEREERPGGQLLMGGAGPLLWLHDGRIVAHAFPNQLGCKKLISASQSIWAKGNQANNASKTSAPSAP